MHFFIQNSQLLPMLIFLTSRRHPYCREVVMFKVNTFWTYVTQMKEIKDISEPPSTGINIRRCVHLFDTSSSFGIKQQVATKRTKFAFPCKPHNGAFMPVESKSLSENSSVCSVCCLRSGPCYRWHTSALLRGAGARQPPQLDNMALLCHVKRSKRKRGRPEPFQQKHVGEIWYLIFT
jgi:hypothetical protein